MRIAPTVLLLLFSGCISDNTAIHSAPKSNLAPQLLTQQLSLHNNTIRLKTPATWTHQRKLLIWGPDCASCSGGEYSYVVSTPDSSSRAYISVTIYPAGNNRFRSVAGELKTMSAKDPQATVIDTFASASRQVRVTYSESWRDQKPVYFAQKDLISAYRTVSVYVQTPKTAENLGLIKRLLETVEVDKAYMAEPYKRSH